MDAVVLRFQADAQWTGRRPGADRGMASRVVVYECCLSQEHPAISLLKDEGFDLVSCTDGQMLVEEVVQRQPAVVIYGLRPESAEDLGVLQLLRRAAPDVPLVLLAAEASLETQRLVQSLRPIYYSVCPVEPAELRDAVRAAVERPVRQSRSGADRRTGSEP